MANQRDIRNRIKSISNTKKITSTMEMVSTAKMKKLQSRLDMTKPYETSVNEFIANMVSSGVIASQSPLFREVADPSRILILTITGNRGLCGSFNSNVIENTLALKDKMISEGKNVLQYVVGKKGFNYMNFINEPTYKTALNLEDKLTFDDSAELGRELESLFMSGGVHEVYISYTKVLSHSSQKTDIIRLMPISFELDEVKGSLVSSRDEFVFEPSPHEIFSYILPFSVLLRFMVFNLFNITLPIED